MKTEAFKNGAEKSVIYCLSHASAFSDVLELAIGKDVSESMRLFSYENPLFWTGENKPKTITLNANAVCLC